MTTEQHPAIIGLTGGIASGKSTVAERWRGRGVPIIDADQVAREVVTKGAPAHASIRTTFGEEVIQKDGELDRAALGRIVFADTAQLDKLNAIVHPAMMTRITERVGEYHKAGRRWLVYEAALIIEKGLNPTLTEVISVIATPAQQLERLMARNPITEQEARERIASQTDNDTRRQASDHIMNNDGSVDALMEEADKHLARLIATYGRL